MYVQRHAEQALKTLSAMFGAVMVSGPRQAGKTTMLRETVKEAAYVTLDDPTLLSLAVSQGETFLKDHPPPVLIDEIQYAPNLFSYIKMILDNSRGKGQFFISGSQQFSMMKNVSETLAGRIGLLTLLGFSLRERSGTAFYDPFLPTEEYFTARKKELSPIAYDEVWRIIHRGCMPELCVNEGFNWQMFYGAYIRTYLERDVRALTQVGDELKFLRFLTAAAARTGQLLNLASLARDVGISQSTADRWMSILVASDIVYLLKPYSNNRLKRMVKTPKLYFLDTGLAASLTRWNTPDVLKNGAMAGPFFESFVLSEILKSYYNMGNLDPPLFYYRDKDMNEIDLLIEDSGILYPLEIKRHADPRKSDVAAFDLIDKIPEVKRGAGGVICLYDSLVTLRGNDRAIPVAYI